MHLMYLMYLKETIIKLQRKNSINLANFLGITFWLLHKEVKGLPLTSFLITINLDGIRSWSKWRRKGGSVWWGGGQLFYQLFITPIGFSLTVAAFFPLLLLKMWTFSLFSLRFKTRANHKLYIYYERGSQKRKKMQYTEEGTEKILTSLSQMALTTLFRVCVLSLSLNSNLWGKCKTNFTLTNKKKPYMKVFH